MAILALISGLAFVLSFVFSLGGIGSALTLVPILHGLGYSFAMAKTTGLFVNTLSLMGGSISNFRNGRLKLTDGLPVVVSAIIAAPAGAGTAEVLPERYTLAAFVAFLFASCILMFRKPKGMSDESGADYVPKTLPLVGTGLSAGFLSGLLGVGGGVLVAPLLLAQGMPVRRTVAVTAFAVTCSSCSGFMTYALLGHFDARIILPVGIMAFLGGTFGTKLTQTKLSPLLIRRLLASFILLLGIRMVAGLV